MALIAKRPPLQLVLSLCNLPQWLALELVPRHPLLNDPRNPQLQRVRLQQLQKHLKLSIQLRLVRLLRQPARRRVSLQNLLLVPFGIAPSLPGLTIVLVGQLPCANPKLSRRQNRDRNWWARRLVRMPTHLRPEQSQSVVRYAQMETGRTTVALAVRRPPRALPPPASPRWN